MKSVKIEIYTRQGCGYCVRAKALLVEKGVAFTEFDVGHDPVKRAALQEKAHGRTTVPQIFINDLHIGGCDDLYEMDRKGDLDRLLNLAP